jgi:hypothetical protein
VTMLRSPWASLPIVGRSVFLLLVRSYRLRTNTPESLLVAAATAQWGGKPQGGV